MVSPPLLPALKGPLKERYSKFEVFLHSDNLQNGGKMVEMIKHRIKRNEFRMRKSE